MAREKQPKTEKRYIGRSVCCVLLIGVAVWGITTLHWEAGLWSNLKMDEIVMQLLLSIEGTGNGMVQSYLLKCVLPTVLVMLLTGLALFFFRSRRRLIAAVGAIAGGCAVLGALIYAFVSFDVGGYIEGVVVESDYIESNYADPNTVQLTFPERKRNLIYIWLESMETTYTDRAHGGSFDFDPIPELTQLALEHENFTGSRGGVNGGFTTVGTTWTAGALFAQTSGLPLKIPIADSAMSMQEHFFPGLTSLGDILEQNGYQQALLIGSNATFGGRRNYFTQHGNYAMWDYEYSLETGEIPEGYKVWWGYEDEKLYTFAKKHLTEMAASGQPFNLTMLTVDTHFPDGYVCEDCREEFGSDRYSNVMACSSRKTKEFLDWVMQQPFYEDTTIILTGDHLTMDVNYCSAVDGDYPRRVYTTVINPAAQTEDPTAYREYTTLDNFPTTLAAMGVKIEGDRLGLGVNLFSSQQTLLERDGLETMNRELKRKSAFLDSLSGISREVYDLSERFLNTHVELEVEYGADSLTYTVRGLSSIEKEFTGFEVFAEQMFGDRRSTLWYRPAERQADGSYRVSMPLDELEDVDPFTVHFYAMTDAGRIKVDQSYLCYVKEQKLVYQENGP